MSRSFTGLHTVYIVVIFSYSSIFIYISSGIFFTVSIFFLFLIFNWLQKRNLIFAYFFVILFSLFIYAVLLSKTYIEVGTLFLILFFGLLPLVNAQFDFLSATATRALLRQGLTGGRRWQFFCGFWDVAVGLICFFLLCLTAVAVAHAANLLSGDTIIDLNAVFKNPQAHIWLFVTFLTTLLPTFLHFILALFSTAITVCWPGALRHKCAAQLYAHHVNDQPAAVAMRAHILIALTAGACTALCVLIARLLWIAFGHVHLAGDFILRACAGWYDVLLKLG